MNWEGYEVEGQMDISEFLDKGENMTENEGIKLGKDLYENITINANNIIPTKKYVEFVKMANEALEEIQQYRAIGTVEEFKALKEKNEPKKVVVEHIPKTSWTKEVSHYLCPSCRSIFSFGGKPYCSNCGQKLDWQ